MNPRSLLKALLPAAALLAGCDSGDNIAGTSSETHTISLVNRPDGTAAAGARVRLYAFANDTQMVRQAYVDGNGQVPLSGLKSGYYSMLVQDPMTGKAAFVDSLYSDGDTIYMRPDTVRATGTVTGKVRVQAMHSPSIAWIHLLRAGIYANADSATGAFTLTGVPGGTFNLVARTAYQEYTPTFRSVKVKGDSVTDLGTIDLVYSGLPLVTGIKAVYDSIAGVVHLSWNAADSIRRSDYFVMRSEGVDAAPTTWNGTATKSTQFNDTVFGAMGTTPSRYDSAERDLNWWVAVRDSNYATGPVWSRVSLHVKSPALARRWDVRWDAPEALPYSATNLSVLDSLEGQLAGLFSEWVPDTGTSYRRVFHLSRRQGAGNWSTRTFDARGGLDGDPVFWGGKLWMVRGASVRDTLKFYGFDGTPDSWKTPSWDSVRILSTVDGVQWDSVTVATGQDSLTAFRLRPSHGALRLVGLYSHYQMATSVTVSEARSRWASADGHVWTPEMGRDLALDGGDPSWIGWSSSAAMTTSFCGPTRDWIWMEGAKRSWLIQGLSSDTTLAVYASASGQLSLSDRGDLLALRTDAGVYLAEPATVASWQKIGVPEKYLRGLMLWNGRLAVVGEDGGLYLGTVAKNP